MQIDLVFTLIPPYPTGQAVHMNLGPEIGLPDAFVLHFDRRINII